jgi:hypothetical protein
MPARPTPKARTTRWSSSRWCRRRLTHRASACHDRPRRPHRLRHVAGTERAGSELVDLYQADDRTITAVILNTGNTVMRLGGEIQLRDESGVVRHTLEVPNVPVLRESERELTFELPDEVEPGFYVALALIQDSRGGVLAGELPLEVP